MIEDKQDEYYRERAPIYEQIYYRDHPGRRSELAAEAERLQALARNRRVLELACGTGYWTDVMSRSAQGILASDLAPEMIVEAQRKSFACPVEFVEADMFAHDFGEARYDLLALGFWFSHQPRQDYERFFEIITRPLKPDGIIWMIDNNPSAEGGIHTSLRTDEHGNHYQMRTLPDGRQYEILKNYFDRADLETAFRPRFEVKSLIHGEFYWSVQLGR